jgi:hypothetical protein
MNFRRQLGRLGLPFLAALTLIVVLRAYNTSESIYLDLAVMVWVGIVPGILLSRLLLGNSVGTLTRWSVGSAIGIGILPTVFGLLRIFGEWKLAFLVVSVLNLGLFITAYFRRSSPIRGSEKVETQDTEFSLRFVFCAVIATTLFLAFYNFANFHFDAQEHLLSRSLFGVDFPFITGMIASIKNFGVFVDMNQLGLSYEYHDFTYRFLASISQTTGTEPSLVLAFSSPLFTYPLIAVSVFALVYAITENRLTAILATVGWFLLGTFVGTEQGTDALSPNFVWGNIQMLNALLVLHLIFRDKERRPYLFAILLFLLGALAKTKIPTYLAVAGAMGIIAVVRIAKREFALGASLLSVIAVSFVVMLTGSHEGSTIRPSNDFLIGAPLMGYANHLSTIFHLPVSALNPVSHGLQLHFSQLFIVPYFLFHLLFYLVHDGRLLVLIVGLILFRTSLFRRIATDRAQPILWLLLLMIPLGFLLPIMYSPTWYPLAISFYGPLVSLEAGAILSVMIAVAIWKSDGFRVAKILVLILLAGSLFGNVRSMTREILVTPDVTRRAFIQGLQTLRERSHVGDVVASRRYDLLLGDIEYAEYFHLYAAYSERKQISSGSAYGALLGALATVDSAKGLHPVKIATDTLVARRATIDSIYLSKNAATVMTALRKYDARYIIEDKEINQHLTIDPRTVAEPFFDNSAMTIWKVRR